MEVSRREAIRLGLLAGAGAAAVGCSPALRRYAGSSLPERIELPNHATDPAARLINRVSFGPTPGEIARVKWIGHAAYVQEQLDASQEDDLALAYMTRRSEPLQMTDYDLRDLPDDHVLQQLQQVAILRAVYSKNQLLERMVDFWTNHFNLYARKGYTVDRIGPDQSAVIRKHALGNFGDLLSASAHSPAMLVYLDNQVNRKGVPNENYARELMELHSLGVHGGYSIHDVQEVARCFTGWSLEDRFLRPRGTFRFREELHDDGEKHVLGHTILAGGGMEDGIKVLGILAAHPATAQHISGKLCRHFVGEGHSALEARASDEFLQTGGDIRAVLKVILSSTELLQSKPLLKRPFDYLVSSLRAVAAQSTGAGQLQKHLEKMGQPLYQWPMPDGYPSKTAAWTGTLLARWNFAFALAQGSIPGTQVDIEAVGKRLHGRATSQNIASMVLGAAPDSPSCQTIAKSVKNALTSNYKALDELQMAATLSLASPDFQWR